MDIEVYVKLIQSYSSYKERDIHSLYDIAMKMGIENKGREVMKVNWRELQMASTRKKMP